MRYSLQPEAKVDLDEIWLYTAKKSGSIEISNRLIYAITDRFGLLGKHPEMGRSRSDLGKGTRSLAFG